MRSNNNIIFIQLELVDAQMGKIPIQDIINRGKQQHEVIQRNLVLCVASGQIRREFVASIFELSKYANKKSYNLSMHMCGTGEREQDVLETYIKKNIHDAIIFVYPFIGFSIDSIDTIFNSSMKLGIPCGVAVPLERTCFEPLKGRTIENTREAKMACASFDVIPDGKIKIDNNGILRVLAYQNQDIVCIPFKYAIDNAIDISRGISSMTGSDLPLYTNFTCSNNGTEGCLLDRLMYVIKKKE